jgi:ribonuclease T2
MPGVISNLDRHEWYKHGTCYGESADLYFQEAVALLNQIDNSDDRQDSAIGILFANNLGNTLTADQIRRSFDWEFGPGAGNKVQVKCDRGGLITELWLNLRGDIDLDTPLAELLQNAPNTSKGCRAGIVDRAGF